MFSLFYFQNIVLKQDCHTFHHSLTQNSLYKCLQFCLEAKILIFDLKCLIVERTPLAVSNSTASLQVAQIKCRCHVELMAQLRLIREKALLF